MSLILPSENKKTELEMCFKEFYSDIGIKQKDGWKRLRRTINYLWSGEIMIVKQSAQARVSHLHIRATRLSYAYVTNYCRSPIVSLRSCARTNYLPRHETTHLHKSGDEIGAGVDLICCEHETDPVCCGLLRQATSVVIWVWVYMWRWFLL